METLFSRVNNSRRIFVHNLDFSVKFITLWYIPSFRLRIFGLMPTIDTIELILLVLVSSLLGQAAIQASDWQFDIAACDIGFGSSICFLCLVVYWVRY